MPPKNRRPGAVGLPAAHCVRLWFSPLIHSVSWGVSFLLWAPKCLLWCPVLLWPFLRLAGRLWTDSHALPTQVQNNIPAHWKDRKEIVSPCALNGAFVPSIASLFFSAQSPSLPGQYPFPSPESGGNRAWGCGRKPRVFSKHLILITANCRVSALWSISTASKDLQLG